MENADNDMMAPELSEHELMLNHVYKDDVELLYLDCCLTELITL